MNYGRMLRRYQKTNVQTAGKLELVIMCYEKTIEFLARAKAHYEEGQYEKKAAALRRALDIINELRSSLNMGDGNQLARNLDLLYAYLTKRLVEGDLRRDLSAFEEGIRIMGELKDAWENISKAADHQFGTGALRPDGMPFTSQAAAPI